MALRPCTTRSKTVRAVEFYAFSLFARPGGASEKAGAEWAHSGKLCTPAGLNTEGQLRQHMRLPHLFKWIIHASAHQRSAIASWIGLKGSNDQSLPAANRPDEAAVSLIVVVHVAVVHTDGPRTARTAGEGTGRPIVARLNIAESLRIQPGCWTRLLCIHYGFQLNDARHPPIRKPAESA